MMRSLGRNSAFTAAGPYKDVAAAGGTSFLSVRKLAPAILDDSHHAPPGGEATWDWTAIAVPFVGFEVVMVAIYMGKLAQLTSWSGILTSTWVVMGDCDMPPAQLAANKVVENLLVQIASSRGCAHYIAGATRGGTSRGKVGVR